jgi:hypothetical protein
MFQTVLRIRIRDRGYGAFLTPGSGMGRKSASGSGIRDEQPGSYFLELRNHFFGFFGVKILEFFDADPGSGTETVRIRDPGSGMEKRRIGIGSTTLVSKIKNQKEVTKQDKSKFFKNYFCLMIEGSGSGIRRPKNTWIRIRIRIQIRNTGPVQFIFPFC